MSPYILPEGYVQISFSGGRTSGYMLHRILEANGGLPDRARVVFANTGREFPQTLDFVHACSLRWGVPITWVEYNPEKPGFTVVTRDTASETGKPFEALILKRKFLPNVVARFCTQELKIRSAAKYLKSIGWDYWTAAVGIRADEPRRVRTDPIKERWQRWYPLFLDGATKETVIQFWGRQGFDLKLPNVNGKTPLGNCDGCFLKSEANLAALAHLYPERHEWWEAMEALVSDIGSANQSGASWSKRYNRRELRENIAKHGDRAFDTEGFLCQVSDGECTDDGSDDDMYG